MCWLMTFGHDWFIPMILNDHETNADMHWNAEFRSNLSYELAARMGSTGGFWSAITRYGMKRGKSSAGIQREPISTIANATKREFKKKTWHCAKKSITRRCLKKSSARRKPSSKY